MRAVLLYYASWISLVCHHAQKCGGKMTVVLWRLTVLASPQAEECLHRRSEIWADHLRRNSDRRLDKVSMQHV